MVCNKAPEKICPGNEKDRPYHSMVYTMVEMAKAHSLNVEKYLTFLLEKHPHAGMTDEELEKLTPWSEAARIYCGFAQQIAFT